MKIRKKHVMWCYRLKYRSKLRRKILHKETENYQRQNLKHWNDGRLEGGGSLIFRTYITEKQICR